MTVNPTIERRRGIEMTDSPRFRGRVRRLAATSGIALGLIWALAVGTLDASPWIDGLLLVGWLTMFAVLTTSLSRPAVRRLVVAPATMVTAALTGICLWELPIGGSARAGWLALTAGILMGSGMGIWFWYRWLPVPRALDDPYAPGRTILIAAHVGLVVGGTVLILVGQVV